MGLPEYVYGTLDYACDLAPRLFRKYAKRKAKQYMRVTPRYRDPADRFFLVRLYKDLDERQKLPLWMRATHVPDETSFVVLEDLTEPVEVQYCLQLHNAERAGRHYDLRIAYKGKAVSWAIPMKGKRDALDRLPRDGERWACIRQPDHSIEYMSFEGTILEGKGKGTVELKAYGIADVFKIENNGTVHLRLHDLPGTNNRSMDFVIVPTKQNTGLIVGKRYVPSTSWDKPRYARRDLEAVEYQCKTDQCTAETKVDGAAIELTIHDNHTSVVSHRISKREGVPIRHCDRTPHLRDISNSDLDGTKLRGEIWHPRGVNFLSGTLNSGIANARQRQKEHGPVQVQVFDITFYKGEDVRDRPYSERRALYEQVCRELDSQYVQPVQQTRGDVREFYEGQVVRTDIPTDGIVIKNEGSLYGKKPIIKVKPSDLADCRVVGVSPGQGKHAGRLGALTVESPSGNKVQVGTGFSDNERIWLWNHRDSLQGEIASIEFHVRAGERTDTGPRFHHFHPDKSSSQVLRMYSEEE